jgi:hypothetical protein
MSDHNITHESVNSCECVEVKAVHTNQHIEFLCEDR